MLAPSFQPSHSPFLATLEADSQQAQNPIAPSLCDPQLLLKAKRNISLLAEMSQLRQLRQNAPSPYQ